MIGLLINLCCSYIYTLNLVVHIFTALYFSFIQKVSASHAPTHYLWFLQQRHRQKPGWALNRLSCITVHTHCKQQNELESALCCGDSHLILDNILVNISASPVTSLCVSLAAQAYYCKAKASLQTCTRCANNATWHCCSYSWRTEKKTPHWFVTQWPVVRSKPKGTHVLWIRAQIYLGNLHEQTSIAKVFASPALVL